jgi:hypothetical protein
MTAVHSCAGDEAYRKVLTQLRLIPDVHRTCQLSSSDLIKRYGLTEEHIRLLDAFKLYSPCRGEKRYDEMDALNLAVHFNVGDAASMLRRLLPRFLKRGASGRFEITAALTCPEPGHPGPCRYAFEAPQGIQETSLHNHEPAAFTFAARVHDDRPDVPPEISRIAYLIASHHFFILPYSLKDDLGFIQRTGVADCVGTTKLFIDKVRGLGMQARACYGLLLAPPFATYHRFPEVLLGSAWVPFDPLLLGALVRWRAVPADDWPPDRPISAAVVRLGDVIPASTHNGEWIMPSFPLRRLPDS